MLCSVDGLPEWDYTVAKASLVTESQRLEEDVFADRIQTYPPGEMAEEGGGVQIDRLDLPHSTHRCLCVTLCFLPDW